MQRAAHILHPGRAPKLGVERQPCFLTSFLEVTMGSKTHLGPRVHVLGTPRLGLQEKEAKFSQCSYPGRITAHSALQLQSPQMPAWKTPHGLGRANTELVEEKAAPGPLSPPVRSTPGRAQPSCFPLGDASPDSSKDGVC